MRGVLAIAAIAAACGGPAAAPKAAPDVATAAPAAAMTAEAPATSFLWRVTSASGGSLYLFGTLHTGGAAKVPPAAWSALAASTAMVREADMGFDATTLAPRIVLPEGESLRTMLGEPTWARLVDTVSETIPVALLERVTPWYATAAVLQKSLTGEPVETALVERAKQDGKELLYLESYEVQIAALEVAFDAAWLTRILASPDAIPRAVAAIVAAYEAGDLDALARAAIDPHLMTPKQFELVVQKRNRSWIPILEKHLAEGGRFVSVGASQLVGAGGLLDLLEQRGHTVERIAAE